MKNDEVIKEANAILKENAFRNENVHKAIVALNRAGRNAVSIFAVIVTADGTVEQFYCMPSEQIVLELTVAIQQHMDIVMERRETEFNGIDEDTA